MKKSEKIKDTDLANVEPALNRASRNARKVAEQTNTPIVVYENGQVVKKWVVRENPPEIS